MKLALIGAGGFRTPNIYRALAEGRSRTRFDEIAFYDPDSHRLARIRAVLDGIDQELGTSVAVRIVSRLEEAIEGADVVYCAVRVGGLEGRLIDETVPAAEHAVGNETAGAGGIGFALRTVPVVMDIARVVDRLAPDALFINFTNPVGLVGEALQRVLGDRVVGICDAPPDMLKRVANALRRRPDDLWFDYFGINHLGWLRAVYDRGHDRLPELLADDSLLSEIEEGRLFGGDLVRSLGMLPHEYLYYYYCQQEAVESLRGGHVRAQFLLAQQRRFYDEAGGAGEALDQWRITNAEREASYMEEAWSPRGVDMQDLAKDREPGGYGAVALDIVDAMFQGDPAVMILNVRNRSSLPFLDEQANVEVPCVLSAGSIRPVAVGDVPLFAKGLILQVRAAERAAVEAAISGSRRMALRALTLHPLVPSAAAAEHILASYVSQHPELKSRFS